MRGLPTALAAIGLAAAGATCEAALEETCPPGTSLRALLCVPDRLAGGACDQDRDDFVSVACGGDDCDDTDGSIHPRAPETCNGRDDDCDGLTDEGAVGEWFVDADGDGFGAGEPTRGCPPPAGAVAAGGDGDDGDPGVHPGAAETCDRRDEDCDGFTDEGVAMRFYRDDDGDGFGDPSVFVDACSLPPGFAAASFDCDDADIDAYPGQFESFSEAAASGGFDYDCDERETPSGDFRHGDCDTCTGWSQEWLGAVPACGETGTLLTCTWSSTTGCSESSRHSLVQECR